MNDTNDAISRDQLLLQWMEARDALNAAKSIENALRLRIVAMQFPNAGEGTHAVELGNGYKLKCANKYSYTLSNKPETGNLTEQALSRLCALDKTDGYAIAQRLVRWQPVLSMSEWKKLSPVLQQAFTLYGNPPALVIQPGLPQLEITEPKETD